MKQRKEIWFLLLMGLVAIQFTLHAQPAKTEIPYEKLFKGKVVITQHGLMTLHKTDGKLYIEMPQELLRKDMLLGSVTEATSNSSDAVAGEQAHDPLCIYFTLSDSSIQIRKQEYYAGTDTAETGIRKALEKNNVDPVLASFKILAVNPASQALVFDATAFFVNGNTAIDPFIPMEGYFLRRTSFRQDNSLLHDIAAYKDNVCISSYLSYNISNYFFGLPYSVDRPATVLMKRSLVLLPERVMRPRLSDPRIGIFSTAYARYSATEDGVKPVYYANRWRLEPKDEAAYKRGEAVEPVTPITFYIDNKFPAAWLPYIQQGVNDWNKAFEAIGFKNAVITLPYPVNDSTFDPNNIRYSCIKYAPTSTQNAVGPSWIDPRTGEILSASVYVYHGIIDLLSDWLFIQTAAADKRARTGKLPADLIGRGIRYVIAHEVGHCLGLMHNMGASASFPVDSLRSPSFTKKYGTTSSIMDYARFNFVAQPGDVERGVQLTPPELGIYDQYAIKWLYSPLHNARNAEEEQPVLEKWISEKIKDPMYRYGKQQLAQTLDPAAQTEDLGDDQVKASRYGLKNLRYILEHLDEWVAVEDSTYQFREEMNFRIINISFYWYWAHVLYNIGGIYQYEKYEGDPFPAYKPVPRAKQKESLLFVLNEMEHLGWTHNKELEGHMTKMNMNSSGYLQRTLFAILLYHIPSLSYSELKGGEGAYTMAECVKDIFDHVWKDAGAGKPVSEDKLSMQTAMVMMLIQRSKVTEKTGAGVTALADGYYDAAAPAQAAWPRQKNGRSCELIQRPRSIGEVAGFGFLPRIRYQAEDMAHQYYGWLLQCRDILQKLVVVHTGAARQQYQYLLAQINRSLKTD